MTSSNFLIDNLMIIKFQKSKIISTIYIATYLLYSCSFLFASTSGSILNDIFPKVETIVIAILILLCIGLLLKGINFGKMIMFIFAFCIIAVSMHYNVLSKSLLIIYLFILAYPTMLESRNIAKVISIVMIVIVILVVFLCGIGILPNRSFIQHGVLRYSLGFTSPNAFANIATITIMNGLIGFVEELDRKKLNYISCLLLIIIIVVYKVTNSRAAVIFGILFILGIIFSYNYGIKLDKSIFFYSMPVISFLFGMLISIFSIIYANSNNIDSTLYNKLEVLFSGRFRYMLYAYDTYGAKWFGNKVEFVSYNMSQLSNGKVKWFGIDNSYMYIMICYGIVAIIGMLMLYIITSYMAFKMNNTYIVIYLSIIALWGLSENIMINIAMNISLLVFADYIMNGVKKNSVIRVSS
ncbi:hypothetical protein QUW30_08780 [Ligilactobacillus salivarius]|nr:hypothetical protein [Ligilactobacillus salivarius]